MKFPSLVLTSILASTTLVQAQIELEGRDGLTSRCMQTPGNTEPFCSCVADRAVAELSSEVRQALWMHWGPPSFFNFRSESSPDDMPEMYNKWWGQWQRKTIPACISRLR
jgi:hypothetical protein